MKRIRFGIVALLFAATSTVFGWHEAGHRTVGIIGFENLSPNARLRVQDLLSVLPDIHTPQGTVVPPDPLNDIPGDFNPVAGAIFKVATLDDAAAWPDKVRMTWLDRPSWHFINFSINGPGGNAAPLVGGDAVEVIDSLAFIARDITQPKPTRAMAVAWIAHLVGDIHQPLHAVAYFDSAHPNGDRGGNQYLLGPNGKPTKNPNLHSFWDGVVGEGPGDVPALVTRVHALPNPSANDVAFDGTHLKETLLRWAGESVALSRDKVYHIGADGRPQLSPLAANFNAAALRPDARLVGDVRVKLAGFRLAALLNAILS